MKNTLFYILFISAIVALFGFAFSFSQDQDLDGKQIFLDSKCNNCHTVTSNEITSKKDDAVDLSNAGSIGDAQLIKSYLLKEVKLNDKNHKLKYKGSEAELNALVNWLLLLKTESEG
ncbi:MAG: c-type cytochrome [Ignavibacteriaceae bacterium]|nr:c-type cytochrome [Ignavibacteriaceae bacterium]